MRALISRILASIATLVFLPVEIVVAGVKRVVQMFVPQRNTDLNDMAEAAIVEEGADDAVAALQTVRSARQHVRRPETERVRMAAVDLREGRAIARCLLDPALPAEAEILLWLAGLDQLQLGFVARGSDAAIARHLDGERMLMVPLLPRVQAVIDEEKEAEMPLSKVEWVRELMRRAAENGDDDIGPDGLDDLMDEAEMLVEAKATLRDYPATRVTVAIDEDAG